MKRANKIILTSLIIGTMSIAGTAMAEATPKNPRPRFIAENNQNFNKRPQPPQGNNEKFRPRSYDRRTPPPDKKFNERRPDSGDRRMPPPPKTNRPNNKPDGKTPPPPPNGMDKKSSSNTSVNIIINNRTFKI